MTNPGENKSCRGFFMEEENNAISEHRLSAAHERLNLNSDVVGIIRKPYHAVLDLSLIHISEPTRH